MSNTKFDLDFMFRQMKLNPVRGMPFQPPAVQRPVIHGGKPACRKCQAYLDPAEMVFSPDLVQYRCRDKSACEDRRMARAFREAVR